MIEAAVFDLGNVLLGFDHRLIERRLAALADPGADDATREADRKVVWELSALLERGAVEAGAFIDACIDLPTLRGRVDAEQFRLLWCDIFWPRPAALVLATALADRMPLVMLSNTNALHAEWAQARHPEVFAPFRATVFSHELGRCKPDPAAFEAAVARAGTEAGRCLYVDDIAAYVDAARRCGLRAVPYISAGAVRDALRLLGIPIEAPRPAPHPEPNFMCDTRSGVLPC